MSARLRLVALLALTLLAIVVYTSRIRHEMADFVNWRRAAVRSIHAEPLYRPEDGHYLFKYFPAFALMMAPFGVLDLETGKALWFAISVGLLALLLRWSIAALPERRLSQGILLGFAIVLMAKFYAHELVLGQVNLLLGALLLMSLLSIQIGQPLIAGGLVGVAVFIKPYALILVPWLLVTQGWPAAAMAAGIVALGLLLPAVVYGWSGNLDLLRGWLHTVTDSTTTEFAGERQRVDCRDVGQMAGPGPRCVHTCMADPRWNPGPGDSGLVAKAVGVSARIPRVCAADAPHSPHLAAGLGLRPAARHASRHLSRGPRARVDEALAVGARGGARAHGSDDIRHHGPHAVRRVHGALRGHRVCVDRRRGPGPSAVSWARLRCLRYRWDPSGPTTSPTRRAC